MNYFIKAVPIITFSIDTGSLKTNLLEIKIFLNNKEKVEQSIKETLWKNFSAIEKKTKKLL